jgi:hypothetical protein
VLLGLRHDADRQKEAEDDEEREKQDHEVPAEKIGDLLFHVDACALALLLHARGYARRDRPKLGEIGA